MPSKEATSTGVRSSIRDNRKEIKAADFIQRLFCVKNHIVLYAHFVDKRLYLLNVAVPQNAVIIRSFSGYAH